MIRCDSPRCCECARPIKDIVEPFIGGVAQHYRCGGCLVHLSVRRTTHGWTVRTAAEHAGQRAPGQLPVVTDPALRHRLFTACRNVARLLQPCEGVEPGMAAIGEVRGG